MISLEDALEQIEQAALVHDVEGLRGMAMELAASLAEARTQFDEWAQLHASMFDLTQRAITCCEQQRERIVNPQARRN